MAISEAQLRASAKYRSKAYDQIAIRAPKGTRDEYAAHAAAQGESLAAFIQRACREAMARDSKTRKDASNE